MSDQKMEHSERKSHYKNHKQSGTNTKKTDRKPSEQLFTTRRSLSYPNLTKYTEPNL